jgi:hypothetical protein
LLLKRNWIDIQFFGDYLWNFSTEGFQFCSIQGVDIFIFGASSSQESIIKVDLDRARILSVSDKIHPGRIIENNPVQGSKN